MFNTPLLEIEMEMLAGVASMPQPAPRPAPRPQYQPSGSYQQAGSRGGNGGGPHRPRGRAVKVALAILIIALVLLDYTGVFSEQVNVSRIVLDNFGRFILLILSPLAYYIKTFV